MADMVEQKTKNERRQNMYLFIRDTVLHEMRACQPTISESGTQVMEAFQNFKVYLVAI